MFDKPIFRSSQRLDPPSPSPGSAQPIASPSGSAPSGSAQSGSSQPVAAQPGSAIFSAAQAERASSLNVAEEQSLYERMNRIYEAVARRAYEIFENDGWPDGHDQEHWFKAESELLHPVHVRIKESDQALTLQAEVPGFDASELQYRLEPRRLTIIGEKQTTAENKAGTTIYKEQCSQEILRAIELPAVADTSRTSATLKSGVLEFTLPKAAPVASSGPQDQAKAAASGR
jgi:HSP20 family protein